MGPTTVWRKRWRNPRIGCTYHLKSLVKHPIIINLLFSIQTAPTLPPSNIQIYDKTSNSITFTWDQPQCGERGGEIISYTYHLISSNGTTSSSTSDTMMTFKRLQPSIAYSFYVAASNAQGRGPFSTAKVYFVKPGKLWLVIMCTPHAYHMYTTRVSHVHRMDTTCTPHGYTWTQHGYHMYTTVVPHQHHKSTLFNQVRFGVQKLDSLNGTTRDSTIIQKNQFQAKCGNLDATNVYTQLDTSTRPGKLHTIDPVMNITC